MTDQLFARVCEEYLTSRGWTWDHETCMWKHPAIKPCGLNAIATINGIYGLAITVAETSNRYDPIPPNYQ